MLDLGDVREVADVYLNGRHVGIAWHTPYALDVTEVLIPGRNELVIEVANTLNNRLVGDAKLPEPYRRTRSNITKLPNAWTTPMADAALQPSGLLGPVVLRYAAELDAP